MTRTQVATFLREFADELDEAAATDEPPSERRTEEDSPTGDRRQSDALQRTGEPGSGDHRTTDQQQSVEDRKRVTFIVGGDSATVTIPRIVEFEVGVESSSPMLSSSVNQGIEFELSWKLAEAPEELEGDWIEIG